MAAPSSTSAAPLLQPSAFVAAPTPTEQLCAICNCLQPAAALQAHQRRCLGAEYHACSLCECGVARSELVQHERRCAAEATRAEEKGVEAMKAARQHLRSADVLNSAQLSALRHVEELARVASAAAHPLVLARVQRLGFVAADLLKALRFLRDTAPLVVHVNLSIRASLLSDTRYKNLFETHTSCGNTDKAARSTCEAAMFNNAYTSNTPPSDRVKYAYLLLKNSVRPRVTIAPCDTLGTRPQLATCESCAHLLTQYSDEELRELLRVAIGERRGALRKSEATGVESCYKEVQIHGPLLLSRDVACVVVHWRHAGDAALRAQLDAFHKRTQVEVIVQEAPAQQQGATHSHGSKPGAAADADHVPSSDSGGSEESEEHES